MSRNGLLLGTVSQSPRTVSERERQGLTGRTWAGGALPVGSSLSLRVTKAWGHLPHGEPHSFQVKSWGLEGAREPGDPRHLLPPSARGTCHVCPWSALGERPPAGAQILSDLLWALGSSLLSSGPGCPHPSHGRTQLSELHSPFWLYVGGSLITLCPPQPPPAQALGSLQPGTERTPDARCFQGQVAFGVP